MKFLIFTILLLHLVTGFSLAQEMETDTSDHYNQLERRYKKFKDSLSLSYHFSPVVSSIVLNNKQIEVNFFNSVLSAGRYRDEHGKLSNSTLRSSYIFSSIQITYGLSKRARWNIGLDINAKAGRRDNDLSSSIFKIFDSGVDGNSEYAKAITSISPRIRWRPFRKNHHLTLQSSVIFPVSINKEQQVILGANQTYFSAQLLYNQPLSDRFFLFPQIALQYGFKNANSTSIFYSPVTCSLGYLIPRKIIIFSLINYVPIFREQENWAFEQYTFKLGAGLQYNISKNIFINAYYAKDIIGKNYNYFDNYTIGLSFISN